MAKRGAESRVSETERLNQFVKILEDCFEKLKIAYEKRDSEDFNRLKRMIIHTQKKIFEVTNENNK